MRIAVASSGVGEDDVAFVEEAERLGADSVWLAEAWGHDAFTPLACLAARTTRIRLATGIAQLGARTPALLAMSAMSMQAVHAGAVRGAVPPRPGHQRAAGELQEVRWLDEERFAGRSAHPAIGE
jgi:hypothetical protein